MVSRNLKIALILLFSPLFLSDYSYSQERLIPGHSSALSEYSLAIVKFFDNAHPTNKLLSATIFEKHAIEKQVGVHKNSEGYHLYYILPRNSIFNSSFFEVACTDSTNTTDICFDNDFSIIDKIDSNVYTKSIDESLSKLLSNIWEEMIFMSRYPREQRTLYGGTQYEFSKFVHGHGTLTAYSSNPIENSLTGKLSSVTQLMKSIVIIESDNEKEKLLKELEALAKQMIESIATISANK